MNDGYLLTDQERQHFILYLETTAHTCDGMIEQLKKLPGPVMDELIEREKIKSAACMFIANDMRSAESLTLR